jgi:hypothetical protein
MSSPGLNVIVPGLVLVVWMGVLAVIMFRRDGKFPGASSNRQALIPIATVLIVWLWIFSMVVFSNS